MEWLLQNTHPSIDWNYALITLIIRFIGVFFILLFIQIALQIASKSVRYFENRKARKKVAEIEDEGLSPQADETSEAIDTATIAAIGMALALESRNTQGTGSSAPRSAAWSIAGRMNQVRFR
jgi:hypothetical protein